MSKSRAIADGAPTRRRAPWQKRASEASAPQCLQQLGNRKALRLYGDVCGVRGRTATTGLSDVSLSYVIPAFRAPDSPKLLEGHRTKSPTTFLLREGIRSDSASCWNVQTSSGGTALNFEKCGSGVCLALFLRLALCSMSITRTCLAEQLKQPGLRELLSWPQLWL